MSMMREVLLAFEEGRRQYEEIMSEAGRPACFTVREVYGDGAKVCGDVSADGDVIHAKACGIDGRIASGDNLAYMTHLLKNEGMRGKLQLIYVDPPFFSGSRYEASVRLESEKLGDSGVLKVGAYDDRWSRGIGEYLRMLTVRLFMMKDLLSETGCLWVHLDWHSVHYVKLILDEIFGPENFVNEVIWNYKSGGATRRSFARKHDTLLFYSRTRRYSFEPLKEKSYNRGLKPYHFKGVEEFCDDIGWYTMVNMKDVWSIDMVGRTSGERNGYATQKPEALLERIISSCSREGDICADFFAGSGTLGAVCRKTKRRWIMCDESRLGTAAQIERMCSCGAVFDVERDAAGSTADRGGEPDASCGGRSAERPDEPSEMSGEITLKVTDGRLELTGYSMGPGMTDTAAEHGGPEVRSRAGGCDIYGRVCEPRSAAKLKEYAQKDGLSLLKFWSVDTEYDGSVHTAENIIPGKVRSCEIGGNAGMSTRTVSVTGYDILGDRFSKIVEL